jgi:hypothetical protein
MLAGHPVGARFGVLLAGLGLAVPCFVRGAPLARCLLECFMGLSFALAVALMLAPPIAGLRARLAYLCGWCGSRRVGRCTRQVDIAAAVQLALATAVLAGAIAAVKAASESDLGLPVRWFSGAVAALAVAEMATACTSLAAALVGLTIPPFFQSPHRSASVGEFWSKRWNLPASELFRRNCFMPLARHDTGLAFFTTFAVSAVAHALLAYLALGRWGIAVICGTFFLVQPLLIVAERRMTVRTWRPASARAWTLAVLAITSPLVVEPLLQIAEQAWGVPDNVLGPTFAVLVFVILMSSLIALASISADEPVQESILPDV